MTEFEADLDAGDIVHLWQKAPSRTALSEVVVTGGGSQPVRRAGAHSDDFTRSVFEAPVAGTYRFGWQEPGTAVSLAYGFTPARVAGEGVRLLHTTEKNRASGARYKLHFQAPWGWMNDPNGLCQIDGASHLFYQHYPHSLRWNTMHWGHAVSENLVDWIDQPIFLEPRAELLADNGLTGGAFSGSAIPHAGGGVRVFYTDREDDREPSQEWQITTVSRDMLSAGPSTPIITDRPSIPNFGKDIRDPYVFKGPDGLWKMVVAGADDRGGLVLLYETRDPEAADGWSYVGILHREPLSRSLPAECPGLVALDGEGEGLYALIFGIIGYRDEATRRRNLSYAIVGRFDGRMFEPMARREVDFGTDCYAIQAFQHADGPVGIAWAANWTDVFKDRDFASAMTFPRRFIWQDGQLRMPPVEGVKALRTGVATEALAGAGSVPLAGGLGEIEIELATPGAPFRLDFAHPDHGIALVYDGAVLELMFDPPGNRVVPRYLTSTTTLKTVRIFVDVGLIEIYADDGLQCATKRLDSDQPISAIELHVDPAIVQTAKLWNLRSRLGAAA
ncbi:glycoside hydrolase family 32 protein [Kaistia defluvii]|uniref:glycoside hydrolase family 32 protein n=1 Tax=Kaistia defluvii TaxID=410841 RepID=UPI0022582C6A|nr:glycoside hydrolase family 32 protein [Kaistia defluvii]MCX5518321.1 glycoside hydrolase family 32 protein [Kaistia defluvii]